MTRASQTALRREKTAARKANRTKITRPSATKLPALASPRLTWSLSLLLALLTIVIYSQVGRLPFVDYDDDSYVTNNLHVRNGLSWDTVNWAVKSTEASNWHPVTWLSHAVDCQLFGLNASGHHWTSLLIHVLNVVLLFLLLQRVTARNWSSFFVAALFALHPLNVESVAWIAERKNVLSTMFFLLSLGVYSWYARKPDLRRYFLLAVLFALGLASKPMVIALPFVLLLLDYWPLQRIEDWTEPSQTFPLQQMPISKLILEKAPLLLLSAGSAAITMFAQTVSEVATNALPFGVRLPSAVYAYGMYIWQMVWPLNLALIYPHPGRTLPVWKPLMSALLIVFVSIVAWKNRASRPYLIVGWLWYLGTAVPIIGIVQVGAQVIANRYAYVPLIGLFLMITWYASSLLDEANVGTAPRAVAASVILLALSALTWRQINYWRDGIDLWEHALAVTTNNSIAENSLANDLIRAGRYEEAMVHLRKYASLEPLDPEAHMKVAADFQDHGQLNDAAREYEAAIRASAIMQRNGARGLDSRLLAVTYLNLALTYEQLGLGSKAAENSRNALATNSEAINQMLQQFAQMLSAQPSANGYVRLGTLLNLVADHDEAQKAFAMARQIDPSISVGPKK